MENLVPVTISVISEAENEHSDWSSKSHRRSLAYKLLLRLHVSHFYSQRCECCCCASVCPSGK